VIWTPADADFLRFCGRFFVGVGKSARVFDGVFVVRLWFLRGKSWEVDDAFLRAKRMPLFENISVEITCGD
jgi:hypothetical protein